MSDGTMDSKWWHSILWQILSWIAVFHILVDWKMTFSLTNSQFWDRLAEMLWNLHFSDFYRSIQQIGYFHIFLSTAKDETKTVYSFRQFVTSSIVDQYRFIHFSTDMLTILIWSIKFRPTEFCYLQITSNDQKPLFL